MSEAQTRKAIETAWKQYNAVTERLAAQPERQRPGLLKPYVAEPELSNVLGIAKEWSAKGWVGYGVPVSHVYWPKSVGSAPTAIMGDCADYSGVGSMVASTGKKLTKGGTHDNTRVTAAKGNDGVWRISKVEYLVRVKCSN